MSERKVAIAVDGSKQADNAFNWYIENMHRPGDVVILIHSAEYKVDIGLPGAAADVDSITEAVRKEDDRIKNMTGNYTDNLKHRSINAKCVVLKGGKPGEQIIKTVKEEDVKCVIMGSRGQGLVRRTLMGSVSDYVLHHAPPHVPVIILRD